MRQISFWAKTHVWPTRIIIIFFIYPVLNLAGWILGDALYLNEIHFSPVWGYLLVPVCIFLCIIYPSKKNKSKNFYTRQKTVDALLIACTFCFILLTGNNFNSTENKNTVATNSYASSITKPPVKLPSFKIKKDKKKDFRKFLKSIEKKYRDAGKGTKALLIVLTILVALGLGLLLVSLSCSLACSGAEVLAYIIFFVGLAGIIFGVVRIIHRITNGPRKKKEEEIKSS